MPREGQVDNRNKERSSGEHRRRSYRRSRSPPSNRHRSRRSRSRSRDTQAPKDVPQWCPYVSGTYNPVTAGSIDGTDIDPHDRAIIRAMETTYRPNKGVQGDPQRTVFVGRIPSEADESDVKDALSRYGSVTRARLVRDMVTGESRRYAFVELATESQARAAVRYGGKGEVTVRDAQVLIEPELERILPGWRPRRLGGGLGGWKESGQLRFGGRARPFRKPLSSQGGPSNPQEMREQRPHR